MIRSPRRPSLGAALCTLALASSVTGVCAQNWPTKPIQLIVPSTSGGALDNYARLSAEHLAQQLKQPVLVENRAGGGGLIAADAAARAVPDGHNLFVATAAVLTINPSAYKKLPYSQDSFAYICKGVESPLVLVAHPSVGAKSVSDLGPWLKKNPNSASYASFSPGTPSHFLGHQLGEKLGIPLAHIPYRGSSHQVTDLLGGNVLLGFTQLATALPHIQSGRLVALATTGESRVESMKNVPTMAEQGFSDLTATVWFGLVAPKATPADVVEKVTQAHLKTLRDPEVKAKLLAQGLVPSGNCGKEFQDSVRQETAQWAKVVKSTGFSANE